MFKLLISLFLLLNSLIGWLFYEDTAIGDYLLSLEVSGQLAFVTINFVVSNIAIVYLKTPFSIISILLLSLLVVLVLLVIGIWIPYWIIYVMFDADADNVFAGAVFFVLVIGIISSLLGPILQRFFAFLSKVNESFFENLKQGAIRSAMETSRKSRR